MQKMMLQYSRCSVKSFRGKFKPDQLSHLHSGYLLVVMGVIGGLSTFDHSL